MPLGELPEDARAWERGVDELAEEDGEIGEYVRQLEQAKDTAELPEASGEAIAREFERYLRRRDDGRGSQLGPGRPQLVPGRRASSEPEARAQLTPRMPSRGPSRTAR